VSRLVGSEMCIRDRYWHHQPFFHSLFKLPSERLNPLLAQRALNHPEALALSLENVGTGTLPSLWHRLKEIRFPVDLITGEFDPKFTELALQMGTHMPRARLSVVEQAGHAVHLEQPGDLAALLS
jgi:2-succinyl-6-hydroxy-2,4-cyclohexadiene-1-carboxylate synthase